MASDKRQFDDFTKFGGHIRDGIYVFPDLYQKDMNGNVRRWSLYIRLIKKTTSRPTHRFNWDITKDGVIPIKPEYLKNKDIPDNAISQVWSESGIENGKRSRHSPTYPDKKNIGRSNERNYLQQALVVGRANFLKQQEKGYRIKSEFQKEPAKQSDNRYYPMLARIYDDEKDHIKYPAVIQPKLDGMRAIVFLNKSPRLNPTYKDVVIYSRNKKDIDGFDTLRKELLEPLKKMYADESLYLDGEFYKHGLRLQDITGIVRNIKKNNKDDVSVPRLHLFDCFYPKEIQMPYIDRLKLLTEFFNLRSTYIWVVKVPTHEIKNTAGCDKWLDHYIKEKYEGIMVKNLDAPYLTDLNKSGTNLRSRSVLKRKQHFTDEFEVVDFTDGAKGKEKGAIMWQLKTANGDTFMATPKNTTYPKRYKLYEELSKNNKKKFIDQYRGEMMSIEYEDLSENGIPLRAKALGLRDYE